MKLEVGPDVCAEVSRALGRVVDSVPLAHVAGTVLVGRVDPLIAARAEPPAVTIPVHGPRDSVRSYLHTTGPVLAPLLVEDARQTSIPIVPLGVPRPEPISLEGADTTDATAELAAAWRTHAGPNPEPAVTWVGGGGGWLAARAACAWESGRAVVVLPRARTPEVVLRGGALVCRSALEVIEATEMIRRTPPLGRALAARGRRALTALPSDREVLARLLEALTIGAESAGTPLVALPLR